MNVAGNLWWHVVALSAIALNSIFLVLWYSNKCIQRWFYKISSNAILHPSGLLLLNCAFYANYIWTSSQFWVCDITARFCYNSPILQWLFQDRISRFINEGGQNHVSLSWQFCGHAQPLHSTKARYVKAVIQSRHPKSPMQELQESPLFSKSRKFLLQVGEPVIDTVRESDTRTGAARDSETEWEGQHLSCVVFLQMKLYQRCLLTRPALDVP